MFKGNLTFLPYKRHGLKGAVKKGQFSVTFDQLRKATEEESLGDGLSESLFETVRDTILKENLPDSAKVHLNLTSMEHSNGTVNSLARKMNSAQNMNPAIGFNATLTFITYPDKGDKGPASKNPNRLPFDLMHKKEDCMIKIKNTDDLCCARVIVTMKECVDGDPDKQYDNLRRGRPIQERLAKQLHQDAGVPEGPCGYDELEKF